MYKTKITYVIATYAGKRSRNYQYAEDTLKINLRQLTELKHNIDTIIITKANTGDSKVYDTYYPDVYPDNVIIYDVKNEGFSNGQWLKAYEKYNDYDYYMFCEDDYCPSMHNFDSIMLDIYKDKFKDNIGFLSNLIQGSPKHPMTLSLHYEGIILVSRETLEKLYSSNSYPNPIQYLSRIDPPFARIIPGGREQVNFTTLFKLSDIPIDDTLSVGYPFIYWNDSNSKGGGDMFFFTDKTDYSDIVSKYCYQSLINYSSLEINKTICSPVQICRTCILVAGMHRSGTSVFSGCLNIAGIDYGKNKAQVMDIHNKKGYYENMSILKYNEDLLSYIGSSWHNTTTTTDAQRASMFIKEEELSNIIRCQFSTNIFFIKDPRISILMPVYLSVLKKMCINIVIVYIDRNNMNIAKSLEKAQGIDIKNGLLLSNKYKNELLFNKGGHIFIRVPFTDFISTPDKYIKNIVDMLHRNDTIDVLAIKNFIERDEVHFI